MLTSLFLLSLLAISLGALYLTIQFVQLHRKLRMLENRATHLLALTPALRIFPQKDPQTPTL